MSTISLHLFQVINHYVLVGFYCAASYTTLAPNF